METKTLIERCKTRDEDAFRILVDSYAEFCFSVTFRILNDEDESKDVVQETFIKIWENISQLDSEKSFNSLLYKILVNKCYDILRRKKRTALFYADKIQWKMPELILENDSAKKLQNQDIAKTIRLLTKKLSPKQKIVFVLSELQGLNHNDISEITGQNKNMIKSNLNHARRNIGKMLLKYL